MNYNYSTNNPQGGAFNVDNLRASLPEADDGALTIGKRNRKSRRATKKPQEEHAQNDEVPVVPETGPDTKRIDTEEGGVSLAKPSKVAQKEQAGEQKLTRRQRKLASKKETNAGDAQTVSSYNTQKYVQQTYGNPMWSQFANLSQPYYINTPSSQQYSFPQSANGNNMAQQPSCPVHYHQNNLTWNPALPLYHPDDQALQTPQQYPNRASFIPPSAPLVKTARGSTHSPGYVALTDPPPRRLSQQQPLLIVLDLNGTLLFRTNSGKSVVPRPGLALFLDYCFRNHTVMVWTSAQAVNMTSMLAQILTRQQQGALAACWGRDSFGLTPAQYNSKIEIIKDLDQVWQLPELQQRHPWRQAGWGWGVGNTVLIDDTAVKAVRQPWNLVQVPEFMKGRDVEEDGGEGQVLGRVKAFLEECRTWDNVAAYMRRWPAKEWAPQVRAGAGWGWG